MAKKIVKTIEFTNINLLMASIAVSIKSKPTTTVKVLQEIITLSENAKVEECTYISSYITTKLRISKENYRAAMSKLYKMNLLKREGSTIFLSHIIKTPFTEVLIVKK